MRSGVLLILLLFLPLAVMADSVSIGGPPFPEPWPMLPPGSTPTRIYWGETQTSLWTAAYVPSPSNGIGGNYYIAFEPYSGTITSFTARFFFVEPSPDNDASFGGESTVTWQLNVEETISVPVTQYGLTEAIAHISLPPGLPPPQITFRDITTAETVPEPASAWLIALGIPGISLAVCAKKGGQDA